MEGDTREDEMGGRALVLVMDDEMEGEGSFPEYSLLWAWKGRGRRGVLQENLGCCLVVNQNLCSFQSLNQNKMDTLLLVTTSRTCPSLLCKPSTFIPLHCFWQDCKNAETFS